MAAALKKFLPHAHKKKSTIMSHTETLKPITITVTLTIREQYLRK